MFKSYRTILLFIVLIGLVGCNHLSQTSEKDKEDNADDEQDPDVAEVLNKDKKKSDSTTASGNNGEKAESEGSDNEKLKHKLKSTVKQIHKTMSEEQDTHDWFMLEEEHPDKFNQELNRIKQPLSAFIADNALKEQARALLKVYTCYCDNYFIYEPKDTKVSFEVTEKTDDMFKAETMTLDDGYGTGWTNKWTFKKEDDEWKLSNYDYVLPDEEPLQLTYEDLEDAYDDPETEGSEAIKFLEYIDIEDIPHLVIQRENKDIEIYNTNTGVMNYTAMEEYARND